MVDLAVSGFVQTFPDWKSVRIVLDPSVDSSIVVSVLLRPMGHFIAIVDDLVKLAVGLCVRSFLADTFLVIEKKLDLGAGDFALDNFFCLGRDGANASESNDKGSERPESRWSAKVEKRTHGFGNFPRSNGRGQ